MKKEDIEDSESYVSPYSGEQLYEAPEYDIKDVI